MMGIGLIGITCAYTGIAAEAIEGCNIHSSLKICPALNKYIPLNTETLNLFKTLFIRVKINNVDEIRVCCVDLLEIVKSKRLTDITGNKLSLGGLDILLIGDLRQLSPVINTAIYKQSPIRHRADKEAYINLAEG
jgi:hypothetical protein